MPPTFHGLRRSLASLVHLRLSTYGVENAVSGGKYDDLRQTVSEATGYWKDTSTTAKPSRLILHLEPGGGGVKASKPPGNTNGNFAYANTAARSVASLFVRILPVMKLAQHKFRPFPEWEWVLWYCFWPKLKNGTGAQLFDKFEPAEGAFSYMGEQPPYIAAGLVTLAKPDAAFSFGESGPTVTYRQATDAIQSLIQVTLPPLEPAPAPGPEG